VLLISHYLLSPVSLCLTWFPFILPVANSFLFYPTTSVTVLPNSALMFGYIFLSVMNRLQSKQHTSIRPTFFWDVTKSILAERYQRFGGTCRIHECLYPDRWGKEYSKTLVIIQQTSRRHLSEHTSRHKLMIISSSVAALSTGHI
jgi:hypothetical protein